MYTEHFFFQSCAGIFFCRALYTTAGKEFQTWLSLMKWELELMTKHWSLPSIASISLLNQTLREKVHYLPPFINTWLMNPSTQPSHRCPPPLPLQQCRLSFQLMTYNNYKTSFVWPFLSFTITQKKNSVLEYLFYWRFKSIILYFPLRKVRHN